MKDTYDDLCAQAYKVLLSTQSESGEFGRKCQDIIHNENNLRHPVSERQSFQALNEKPNCSVSLMSALGIKSYKGIEDDSIKRVVQWFTKSDYVHNGWFRQKIHIVDVDPFGDSTPQLSTITDVRHTSTALLAALSFNAPVTFISDALRNLLSKECKDNENKGWKSIKGSENAPTDFYTTIYMLKSLYILKKTKRHESYNISLFELNQLLSNGLSAICKSNPNELGYTTHIAQTLRTNGTLLYLLAPLLYDLNKDYLYKSVNFVIKHVGVENKDFWKIENFDAITNILVGLIKAYPYVPESFNVDKIIEYGKEFIREVFPELESFHPVSLGFILYIFASKSTETRMNGTKNQNKTEVGEKMIDLKIDVLILVATNEEEQAITKNEKFEEYELPNEIVVLYKKYKSMNIALARGYEYGEVDAAIMAQTLYIFLKPRIVAMVGFCAGKKGKQVLGDVVIAEKVFNYDLGKQVAEDKYEPQLSNYKLDVRLKQKIERYHEDWRVSLKMQPPKDFQLQCYDFLSLLSRYSEPVSSKELYDSNNFTEWAQLIQYMKENKFIKSSKSNLSISAKGKNHLNTILLSYPNGYIPPKPSTKLGVLATGTKVQQWDGIFEFLNQQYDRKCSVLDMEGHAVGKIAEFNKCPFIIVKGVGDYAQNGKKFDNRFIEYAVYASYTFLVEFLSGNFHAFDTINE